MGLRTADLLSGNGTGLPVFQIQNVTVDMDKGAVFKNGQNVNLSALEYRPLCFTF